MTPLWTIDSSQAPAEGQFIIHQKDWVAVPPVHDYNNKQAEGFLNHQPLSKE
ncbi:MAG TPA: hypothetical protein V6D27_08665 [Vampirovibrionales bacterium]